MAIFPKGWDKLSQSHKIDYIVDLISDVLHTELEHSADEWVVDDEFEEGLDRATELARIGRQLKKTVT